jgi:hypothetical protein
MAYLFRFDLVISFLSAAPSSGLSSSKEHSKSSETDMTAPKFCEVSMSSIISLSMITYIEFSTVAVEVSLFPGG